MGLDFSVSGWGNLVFVAWLLGMVIYSANRYGVIPKPEHLRDPRDIPVLAFWNVFSREKWTPEGLAFHRRVIAFSAKALLTTVVLWIVLDLLT